MPVFNIPGKVRFWLYILAAVSLLVVVYTSEKGWSGPPEAKLVQGLAALAMLLAAAKTDTSGTAEQGAGQALPVELVGVPDDPAPLVDAPEGDVDPDGDQDPDNPRAG